VAGEYKDNLLVIEGSIISKEYLIPKDKVGDYDGTAVSFPVMFTSCAKMESMIQSLLERT
jgi:hypothetical protein